jgi:8-oxo-dGTP diphosphatase
MVPRLATVIEAAGGVVWRTGAQGAIEVLLIHRPGRRDWSLPKGKLDRGESALAAAVREVVEETGHRVEVGPELGITRYTDRKGRAKRVRYWAMVPTGGRFLPTAEVDGIRWEPLHAALPLLADDHDVPIVQTLVAALTRTG